VRTGDNYELIQKLAHNDEYSGSKAEVSLMTEVKQGNPLTPFIFNAIMDFLLEQMKGYVIEKSHSLLVLAFADHLIHLATAKEKAQSLLNHTESYLQNLRTRTAAEKCPSFEIRPTNDSWYIGNPDLRLTKAIKQHPQLPIDTYKV
jgi:hypothetical protein